MVACLDCLSLMAASTMWDGALAAIPGFEQAVADALERIEAVGPYQAMEEELE